MCNVDLIDAYYHQTENLRVHVIDKLHKMLILDSTRSYKRIKCKNVTPVSYNNICVKLKCLRRAID